MDDTRLLEWIEMYNGTITAYVSDDYRYRNTKPAPEGGIMDNDPKDFYEWRIEK